MQFPVPPAPVSRHPEGPARLAAAQASSRQPHLHGELPKIYGTPRLASAQAAASADGTGSHALACARLHGSRRAARAGHTGTCMCAAMAQSCRRCRAGVAFTPCQQGHTVPWP